VGKAALEGLPGVIQVDRGWHGLRESNTVWYDPDKITINRMEGALKDANTYRGTVRSK
jgi:hypothetical protein